LTCWSKLSKLPFPSMTIHVATPLVTMFSSHALDASAARGYLQAAT
jgi:hypothetical protein